MTPDILFLFCLLAITIVLFVTDKIRLDIIAIGVIVVLIVSGQLTAREATAGFGDPVVILIAGLFVVGEALYLTGIANNIGTWLLRVAGQGETRLILLLMLVVAVLSAFMSSTGTVAIFIPIALTLARQTGVNRGKLLMPMSVAALIGGMLTLIGTPPNLVVSNQLDKAGFEPFHFFDFTPFGLLVLFAAIGYVVFVARRTLPESDDSGIQAGISLDEMAGHFDRNPEQLMFTMPRNSQYCGMTLTDAKLRRQFGLIVTGMARRRKFRVEILPVHSNTILMAGDTLFVTLEINSSSSTEHMPFHLLPLSKYYRDRMRQTHGMAEIMVSMNSDLIGKNIFEFRFRDKYDLNVLAVFEKGEGDHISALDRTLQRGDVLLVAGSWRQITRAMHDNQDAVLLSMPEEYKHAAPRANRAPFAIAILGLMLLAMTLSLTSVVAIVLIAALAFGATGCINMKESYACINWQSLVLIAGMLPMATALQKSGAISLIVNQMVLELGDAGPRTIMAALFVVTAFFSQFISNTATAVLVAPVATGVAASLGISPYPMVMAVAIAASTAFSTPVASPVNTLVLGPGNYKFTDFAKVGVPLQLIILLMSVALLPWFFPF